MLNNRDRWEKYKVQQSPEDKWEKYKILNQVPENDESLLESLLKSPFRIGADVVNSAIGGIGKIPEYYEKSKTEIPGLINLIRPEGAPGSEKLHALGQALAGLPELGHNVLNLPHGMAQYAENRLNLLPKGTAEKIPYQEDISQQINQLFGEPKYPGEALLRGTVRNFPQVTGAAKLAPTFNPLNLTAENIVKNVAKGQTKQLARYGDLYTGLFNEARQAGIPYVSADPRKISHAIFDLKTNRANPKYIQALETFYNDPIHENAQAAMRDLGALGRVQKAKDVLTEPEQNILNITKDVKNHIQEKMFENKPKLLEKHKKIQKGYRNEVVPYTEHEPLQQYIQGDLLSDEVLPTLNKGKFRARLRKEHPLIARDKYSKLAKALAVLATGGKLWNLY